VCLCLSFSPVLKVLICSQPQIVIRCGSPSGILSELDWVSVSQSPYRRDLLTSSPAHQLTKESKVAFVVTLLSGRSDLWGTTVWEQGHHCCSSFQLFSEELRKVFDRAASGREAVRELAELRQGDRSVTDYSIEFGTLAAEFKWNQEAQWDMFWRGLADRIVNEIYTLELPTSLDGLIDLAIRVDTRLQHR
uniref:Retrotransposon gag domain-containing protein n=1 Tax=Cyprinus carpio carpio TaxID=630221 RepID=A0A9J7ZZV9_CYPCA